MQLSPSSTSLLSFCEDLPCTSTKMATLGYIALITLMMVMHTHADFEPVQHWLDLGKEDIKKAWDRTPTYAVAKNLILMVGDGLGLPTITAGRIYKGQKMNKNGEESKLVFEDFPNVALSKTYNLDRQVADSAGTASTMMSGIKVNMGTLGVTGDVPYGKNCSEYSEARKLTTVLDYALQEGKSVGVVTNTRITHATPGSTYAHTPWRDWESDANMAGISGCEKVKDIAYQLVMDNPNIQVLLGGGRRAFMNTTTLDSRSNEAGQRLDGLDLREEWKKEKAARNVKYAYVENKGQFDSVDASTTDYLLGLFTYSHMSYEVDRDNSASGEPSLTQMVDKAIQILKKNPKGFFLLVEGGRIDHAHHDNYGKKALVETVEFDNAVSKVMSLTKTQDTLTIVTADHSHVFTMAGYPSRGNDILGTVDIIGEGEEPADNLPYLTLGYTNGPAHGRVDYTGVDTTGNNFQQPGCLDMPYETHGGEDVAIYAQGPMAHLFHTTHEQSYIGHVLMYSGCIGQYKDDCDLDKRECIHDSETCGAFQPTSSMALYLLAFIMVARGLIL